MSTTPTALPPPPDPKDVEAAVPSVQKTRGEKIWGAIGSRAEGVAQGVSGLSHAPTHGFEDSAVGKALNQHYQERLAEARTNYENAQTFLSLADSGKDAQGNPLSPEQMQDYKTRAKVAYDAYQKSAGVNKDLKAQVQQKRGIFDAVLTHGSKAVHGAIQKISGQGGGGQPQQAAGGAQQPGGMSGPPATGTAPSGPPATLAEDSGTPSVTLPPPPAPPAAPASVYSPEQSGMQAATMRQQMGDTREMERYRQQQAILRDNKIAEDQALAAAKAQSGVSPRPVFSRPLGVLDARTLAQQGKIFMGDDGTPLDTNELPDTMALVPFVTRVDNKWETRYLPVSPSQQTVTVGGESYAISPYDKSKLVTGEAGADIGAHNISTTSRTTDPATGQTTVATHAPTITGAKGRAVGAPAGGQAAPAPSKPRASTGGAATGTPPLDADGHIPVGTPGLTPQVVEGANRLLDGIDAEKLPTKTRALSGALARKYGWEQDKFTPKEQVMLRESTTYLQKALIDPSLSALDEGTGSRLKIAQVLANQENQNMIGRGMSTIASMNLNENEAAFVRMYNQLVGTISGMASLVRSGRATEATIDRLKMELPNPTTTKDSADGRARIKRILTEIDVAQKKGMFEGTGATSRNLPPPPSGEKKADPLGIR